MISTDIICLFVWPGKWYLQISSVVGYVLAPTPSFKYKMPQKAKTLNKWKWVVILENYLTKQYILYRQSISLKKKSSQKEIKLNQMLTGFRNRSKIYRYYQWKTTENNLFREAAIRGEFVIASLGLHKT